MTDKRNNLDRLFAAARAEAPVITFGETRGRVEETMNAGPEKVPGETLQPYKQTHSIMITTGIGIITAGLIGFLAWNSDGADRRTGELQRENENRPTAGNVVVESATPVPLLSAKPGRVNTAGGGQQGGEKRMGKEEGKKENDQRGEEDTDGIFPAPAPFISGIRMAELTREELGRLGLQPESTGVWFFYDREGNPNGLEMKTAELGYLSVNERDRRVDGFGVMMDGIVHYSKLEGLRKEGVEAAPFQPMFITDDYGNRRISIRDGNDPVEQRLAAKLEELVRKTAEGHLSQEEASALYEEMVEERAKADVGDLSSGRLIPILVRTGYLYTDADKAKKHWRPDCIFWYAATPQFLAALPERVRIPLERELRLALVLQGKPDHESMEAFVERQPLEIRQAFDSLSSEGTTEAVAVVAGEAFTGAFSGASGALTASGVAPNPAQDRLTVRFTLGAARTVSLALYDVQGKLLQTFGPASAYRPGENAAAVELQGMAAGMYLLVIATEKGERAVQRVIVE